MEVRDYMLSLINKYRKSSMIFLGLCFALISPIFPPQSNFFLILGVLGFLLFAFFERKDSNRNTSLMSNLHLVGISFFFVIPLVGLPYSIEFEAGKVVLQRMFLFGLIPVVLFLSIKSDLTNFYKGVIIGILNFSVLFSICFLVISFFGECVKVTFFTDAALFIRNYFHHTYIGVYVFFAFLYVLYQAIIIKKRLRYVLLLLFSIVLIILFSRILILVFFIHLCFYLFKRYHRAFSNKNVVLVTVVSLVFLSGVLIRNRSFVTKNIHKILWDMTININKAPEGGKWRGDSRASRWDIAWYYIKKRPILGAGTGSEMRILRTGYRKKQMWNSYNKNYNVHNQYLFYLVENGLIGLCICIGALGCLFISLSRLSIHKEIIFWLLVSVVFIFLVENYLSRLWGIHFLSVVIPLAYCSYSKESSIKKCKY